MAVPARLSRKLRDVLGEAAEDMISLMDDLSSERDRTTGFQQDTVAALKGLDDRVHQLDDRVQQLDERVGRLEDRVQQLDERVGRLDDRVQRLDDRVQGMEVRIIKEISSVKADLMKWSFLFWVGAVTAIALLAGVLGR